VFSKYFNTSTSAAPLAVFRIAFGLMMFLSIVRFWSKGWINELYITPRFLFPYYGFEFVSSLGIYTYGLFIVCSISAIMVMLGWHYRLFSLLLFLSFTYIELLDKSTYLNHYYFISLVCLLMVFMPAHVFFSIDSKRKPNLLADTIPRWYLDSIKLLVAILYFYAGLAKINSDWLLHALPLKIWLPARNDIPIIGFLFNYSWVHYIFSWFGCIYDLSIPFLLWNKHTRLLGYAAVVIFHLITSMLFPIGMFPYIMIVTALVFFSDAFHMRVLTAIGNLIKVPSILLRPNKMYKERLVYSTFVKGFFVIFFVVQLLFPFRYLLYPGNLFWTEQGYRFSWRVMLIEKAGYAQFEVKQPDGHSFIVNNNDFLSPLQEKMMATQPDMIVQYAHFLKNIYTKEGESPEIYVDSYVTLNGRMGTTFIDPTVNLANIQDSFSHKNWIVPLNE
jgi:hypothetical protein